MNILVSKSARLSALALVGLLALAASQASAAEGQLQAGAERQSKSVSSLSGNSLNSLSSSNVIEHTSSKSRIESEKRQVQEFLNYRNIIKSIMKLIFGNPDEVNATSRSVLNILTKLLDIVRNSFGNKSRTGTGRTMRDSAEDAVAAGAAMLQGYVKSVLATDDQCVKRYLCQASKEATRDGRELGYIIASVGGYASSYLLDNSKAANFKILNEASTKGRHPHEDCAKIYPDCGEQN